MFNLDPKKMQAVMKQMGIAQEEIPASKVIIEKTDNTKIVIENPSVTKIKMQGQESFQVVGNAHEAAGEKALDFEFSKEDIKTVMQQAGCTEKQALKALEKTKDLAEAILLLKK